MAFAALFVQSARAQSYLNWVNTIGDMTGETANDMVVDDDENIYIVGDLHGPADMNPNGTAVIVPAGVYVAKYDKNGAFVWVTSVQATSGTDIIINSTGDILITGSFTGSVTFGSTTVTNSQSSTASVIYIAAFDAATGAFQGSGIIEGTGDQVPMEFKANGNNLYLAGSFKTSADFDIGPNRANYTQNGTVNELFVAKFDNEGGLDWVKTIASNSANNNIDDIEISASGDVYTVGRLWQTLDFENGTNLNGSVGVRPESFIFKVNATGAHLWDHTGSHSGGNSRSGYYSLEFDSNGDLTIAGFVQGTVTLGGFSTTTSSVLATANILLVKYAPDGTALTNTVLGGEGDQFALHHKLDANDNYIIAGVATGPNNDFDPDPDRIANIPFAQTTGMDVFVAKYSKDIIFQWAGGFLGTTLTDWVRGISVSPEGNIYIAGYVQDDVDFDFDDTGVQKNGISGGRDLYIASLNNVATLNQKLNLCFGSSVQVGSSTYNSAGTYQDIFPGAAATGQDSVVNTTILAVLNEITLTANANAPLCAGEATGSVVLTASDANTRNYRYSLDGMIYDTSPAFTGLLAGNYTAYVIDDDQCTASINFQVPARPALTATAAINHVLCNGDAIGSVAVLPAGGTSPYVYSFNQGAFVTDPIFTGLSAGVYPIVVKDSNGCTTSLNIAINQPDALNLNYEYLDVSCNGSNDGQIGGAASGGTGPYEYSLDGTNFQTGIFTNLAPDTYTLTVKDANGCIASTNVTITEPTALNLQLASTDITCNGDDNGTLSITASGGTTPYLSIKVNDEITTTNDLTSLSPGQYTVQVTDANGCLATAAVTITEPDELTLSAATVDVTCNGDGDGQINLTAAGGTAPYEYSMDGVNFQTSSSYAGLVPEIYSLVVRDANGCTTTTTATITEPDALSISVNLTNFNTITATAAGGTAPYEYSIGAGFQTSGTFNDLANGNYTVTARDANGCTVDASQALIVTAVDAPVFAPTVRSYPNPADNYLIISKVDQGDVIQLMSLNGKLLERSDIYKSQSDYRHDITGAGETMFILLIKDKDGRIKARQKVIRK
jgi:hypothetical protein